MPSELLVPVSLKDATLTDVGVVGAVVSTTMVDVERLVFEDNSIGLDVDREQMGGQAVIALGALVGPGSIKDPAVLGFVIVLLDDGMSFDELAAAAIDALSLQSNNALVTTL